ncbi:MAG: S41 family peptidase, partial [Leeuwenhoekiella sp.]
AKTLDVGGQNVGYLMYNSFTSNFDEQLNDAFAQFKADGVTDLVLDLRYNGGGSVRTATDLAAMITGQYTGEIFSTEVWNPEIQAIYEEQDPEGLKNLFNSSIRTGAAINSLNLNRVYILATGSSASASELVINGLDPYINVIQIGTTTVGKFQASTTFYDSEAPNFQRDGVNPNHFYAIQPLILTSANANGVTGFVNGIDPDIEIQESIRNLGTLGDPNEPLLAAALDDINPNRSFEPIKQKVSLPVDLIGESNMKNPTYQRMYVDIKK